MIEDIRAAAHAQLEGIGQISTEMHGIDQATQQNAAMVEESAAGTMSLAEETQHLRNAVAIFKLEKSDRNLGINAPLALPVYG